MDMNKLTITISGPTGSGKTTLAYYISEFLKDDGLNVTVQDADDDNFILQYKETGPKYEFWERISKNLASIAEKTELVIVTAQQKISKPIERLVPEYEWSSMNGTWFVPCKIVAALLPPDKKLIWFDPFDDGIGEERVVDAANIRYV